MKILKLLLKTNDSLKLKHHFVFIKLQKDRNTSIQIKLFILIRKDGFIKNQQQYQLIMTLMNFLNTQIHRAFR